MNDISCECAVCKAAKSKNVSEYDLHMFVGSHKANCKAELHIFEDDIQFESVTHWDIGYCGKARYYIYRDNKFNAIAWYDTEMYRGYKLI